MIRGKEYVLSVIRVIARLSVSDGEVGEKRNESLLLEGLQHIVVARILRSALFRPGQALGSIRLRDKANI